MAAKTPVKATFTGSDVTGLAEFQTADFIAVADGGTGLSSLGSAGQVLKVNSGATALEYGNVEAIVNIDGATDLTGVTLTTSDLLLASDGGTEGRVNLGQLDTLFSGTSSTLTNKTISGASNTLSNIANSSLTNSNISFLDDSSTSASISLGNTFKIAGTSNEIETSISGSTISIGLPNNVTIGNNLTVTGNLTVSGTTTTVNSTTVEIQNAFVFEGATADAFETTLTTIDPTADRTISLPNATGTIVLQDTTDTLTNKTITSPTINTPTITGNTTFSDGAYDFDIASHDGSNGLKLGGTLVTSTAAELNYSDGVTSNIQTQLDAKATNAFAIAQAVALG